ncbi:MAG: histidine phosphatase family protein [Flavobacteriaceae bacterium]|nr:histidine phosphatase family protein [Flavobacteriaceae bacterium]
MKKIIFLLFILTNYGYAQGNGSTFYLIRHAEKQRTELHNKNPHLNSKGTLRAENWSRVFKHIKFDLIYSTSYHRTQETATPTSLQKTVPIHLYDPKFLYTSAFKEATKNKTVLIVGHSNTSPAFANKIIGSEIYPAIDDLNNSNLYIIQVKNEQITHQLLYIPL